MTGIQSMSIKPIVFTTPDGLELEADAWGDAECAPVLLRHGGGQIPIFDRPL